MTLSASHPYDLDPSGQGLESWIQSVQEALGPSGPSKQLKSTHEIHGFEAPRVPGPQKGSKPPFCEPFGQFWRVPGSLT